MKRCGGSEGASVGKAIEGNTGYIDSRDSTKTDIFKGTTAGQGNSHVRGGVLYALKRRQNTESYRRDELEPHLVVMWLGEGLAGVTRHHEARDMAWRLGSPLAWRKRTGTF